MCSACLMHWAYHACELAGTEPGLEAFACAFRALGAVLVEWRGSEHSGRGVCERGGDASARKWHCLELVRTNWELFGTLME